MKGFKMYNQIKQLKELGFSKVGTAKQLGINRETVTRYWNMTADEFEHQLSEVKRAQVLAKREEVIIKWLKEYPTVTAAQVCDWLKEHYNEKYSERTVSRYVKELRNKYRLLKSNHPREYEAVEELPMGQQMQVDFGQKTMKSIDGFNVKVYFAAFVLAHSRYKWGFFQTRPFRTTDLVVACNMCFQFIGGMPLELVFDQDSIVSVSENYGDVIHTYEFEKYRQECNFKIHLCRKADPESKGKIESVVKFIKYNFVENRLFVDEVILNQSFLDWLDRTGNRKIHSTTKKVPIDIYKTERDYLRPLKLVAVNADIDIYRTVRKDNTIIYDSNRYSLPLGTYGKHKEVCLVITEGQLALTDIFRDHVICEHAISTGRGQLIKNTSHSRDKESSIDTLEQSLNIALDNKAINFLKEIRHQKSRYSRDQFGLIKTLLGEYALDKVLSAIQYCEENRLYSATYVKGYLKHVSPPEPKTPKPLLPIADKKYHVTTEKRLVSVYAKAGGMQ